MSGFFVSAMQLRVFYVNPLTIDSVSSHNPVIL